MKIFNFNLIRDKYLPIVVDSIKLPYIKLFHRERTPWEISMDDLKGFNKNSLGHHLYLFLIKNNLSIQPLYESHDVYHVLTGYGIGMINEARLFFFLLGNGKKSVSILGSTLVAILLYPNNWSIFKEAYSHGKEFRKLFTLNFEGMLHADFDGLHNSLLS